MMSKELQNLNLIYVNLMTDVFKIIAKYLRKVIVKYRHLSPSGNRALEFKTPKMHTHTHAHTHIYICVYIYMCVYIYDLILFLCYLVQTLGR